MSDSTVSVTVNDGQVHGIKEKSPFSGVEYASFYGIPYGKATSGELRFQDPVKVEPWNGVLDASTPKTGCSQFSLREMKFTGTEDCLYVNIFAPKLESSNDRCLKPVIVLIHPGGLVCGSPEPSHYGSADYVMHNDVVYVGIAYRLHILGFLNLGMKECSGNQALKDIIMGLEWIRDNIKVFSGDPDNVTLLGSSSGCELIHLLMLSPLAKGLFHKAVIMGMYAFNPTLCRRGVKENESAAMRIARKLGYKGNDKKRLLAFLKKAPIKQIIEQLRDYKKIAWRCAEVFISGVFYPTIDVGDRAVLPMSPLDLIPSMMKIPIIFGICEREGVLGFCLKAEMRKRMIKYLSTTFRQNEWGWGYHLKDNDVNAIIAKAKSFYTNGEPLENASLATKVDFQTDVGFSDVYDTLLNVISKDFPASVFVYKFLFEGCISTLKNRLNSALEEPLDGTFHFSDYEYWAYRENQLIDNMEAYDSKTTECVYLFTKLITTFARTGNPNFEGLQVQWRPTSVENPCHLIIDDTLMMVDGKPNDAGMRFWEGVKKDYRHNKE